MKKSKIFFKLGQTDKDKTFWNKRPIKAIGENRIGINDQEYDIKPNNQEHFTNTKLTTENMVDKDKSTVYNIQKIQVFIL